MTRDPDNPLATYSPFENADQEGRFPSPGGRPAFALDTDDDEIAEMERRLNLLDAMLSQEEKRIREARETGTLEPPPDWPRFYPFVHFDVREVPEQLQRFVNEAMFGWCCMVIAFVLNFISCLSLLRAGDAADSPGSKIALSALYLFLVVPMSLDLSALSVYRTLRDPQPGTLSYLKVFLFLSAITLFQAILTLGLESSGSCGLITVINLFSENHAFIGFLALLVTLFLFLSTFVHLKLLTGLWRFYRGTREGEELDLHNVRQGLARLVVESLNR
jgi:hypothetical protein